MKHGIKKVKFKSGQDANQALMRKLVISFVELGRISTTLSKAKAVKSAVDRLVYKATIGKESDKNVLLKYVGSKSVVKYMLGTVGPSLVGQTSGYTRLTKMGPRQGDNAEIARLEWVKPILAEQKVEKKAKVVTEKKQK